MARRRKKKSADKTLPLKTIFRNRKRAAKRANHRDCCSGKKRYDDKDRAIKDAKLLLETTNLKKASVYVCPICCRFHVSKQVQKTAYVILEKVVDNAEL